jgi:hypothetical protein
VSHESLTHSRRGLLLNRNVVAWLLLVTALAVHVLDEALTDFLHFYNPLVSDLKERISFFQMPTFTFGIWLGGLIGLVIIGFALTPLVNRGGRFIRRFTTAFGIIMVLNALGHMFGSLFLGRLLPGFRSSPLLLITALYVVIRGFRRPAPSPGFAQSRAEPGF